ncbi:sugar transferase [Glaesserella parasuis]|uniref:Putative glycosyltransferase/lipopolysaccharide biosynthesis protein n=2 Tax=Glaesserella parasuis TaxID=738 RepID=T1RP00_GLAPU|nr:sugar transferase [Glaesserella parasuis]AGM38757.1 putative glycosyltransferase/lipopolysaccharide biosynthesis protein [Glaesserella parasuis]AGM38794.1 putative glycosyltransferase/lipopolysaccharide biosynthesis protein [Glaesserella parasuis]MCT8574850.1 sugar transferase [Glaesserella parasuis]MCT8655826.1 sugar transferase [Glaesserella parasuis]MCT8837582.1 sugar transferase [Glaesserella parasuis]
MLKRFFDIFFSGLGLIALFPVFMVIAIWIKKDSDGEVFFRQVRVGLNGQLFKIHKFRTMAVNTEKQSGLTIGNDKRITNAGKFLRKYKLDELPQLIDVFIGKMSLVGPRPEIPEFMNLYSEYDRRKILSVKPGITDRASIEMVDENEILGKYDNPRQAYIDIIMPMKARYYIDYANNHNIWSDFVLILRTFLKIVSR